MKNYTEYEKNLIDNRIAELTIEEGEKFSQFFESNSKSHGVGVAIISFTILGVPFFYYGFDKFKTSSIILWIIGLLTLYILVGIVILIVLSFIMYKEVWTIIENINYALKDKYLTSLTDVQ